MRVSTNSASMVAQRNLGNVNRAQEVASNRLSSGDRIYQASFDPSGLAISEKMRSHIRSMRQANRNTQEGISFFQVAEGALETIQSASVRMKELAMQAANDTVGDAERSFADKEYQAIKAEVMRVSAATNYNGQYLLNDSGQNFQMQVGIFNHDNERINYDMSRIIQKSNAFGAGGTSITSKQGAQQALDVTNSMITEISSSRAQIGAISNRMESALANNRTADENLSASKSKIRDADYAEQASEKVRADILRDGGTKILREANGMNDGVMKLVS